MAVRSVVTVNAINDRLALVPRQFSWQMSVVLMGRLRSFLAKRIHSLLGRWGYLLSHFGAGLPETLEAYLVALGQRGIGFDKIYVFDDDPETLNAFLAVFDIQQVTFSRNDEDVEGDDSISKRETRALVATNLTGLEAKQNGFLPAEAKQASAVVIRLKLSQCLGGNIDLISISDRMATAGFRLQDVLQRPLTHLNASTANVFLAFERADAHAIGTHDSLDRRALRVSEALNHLVAPIVSGAEVSRLCRRGSHGFSAGLLNPGALCDGERIFLVARGERFPWPVQKRCWKAFMSSCQPVLLTLESDFQISQAIEVSLPETHDCRRYRYEDFRVFKHQGRVYSNHSVIQCEDGRNGVTPIRPERLRTMVGISHLDTDKALLTYLGPPRLDRPVRRAEKNWPMFSSGERVHLIYTFNPYRLFSAAEFPSLQYSSVLERELSFPLPEDGVAFRNSINPVSYSSDHFLHIVHKVYPEKRYVFWAVLIDKRTLLPARISRRPLLSAGWSAAASIIYASSAICRENDVLIFGGIDDCAIGVWRIEREALDRHWTPVV